MTLVDVYRSGDEWSLVEALERASVSDIRDLFDLLASGPVTRQARVALHHANRELGVRLRERAEKAS